MKTLPVIFVFHGLREVDKRQGWRGPLRTVDLATLEVPAPDPSVKLAEGDMMEGVVTKVARDHVLVQIGGSIGRLAFDDMAWASKYLKGKDPTKDAVPVKNIKQLLTPGDVIEVGVKKLDKEVVHLRLEQTPVVEGALVAVDPKTGAIRAMVGGYDFARSEYNRAVLARRQPGSSFKPIIYATAMNQGMSPATVVLDAPVVYEQEEEDKTWKPENYGNRNFLDDMAWASKYLKGKDPTKDAVPVKNIKQLLTPGDVIEVGVKKLDKEVVHLRLEQTPVVEGALVAVDPKTGAIRAMVGGYDFARSEYNRAVLARRQPGSSFKPIIYATAMNQGMSPATVVLDAPVVYEQEEEDKTWKPENYGKRFHGIVSLREALIHSHNLATVRLLDKIGIRNVIDFSRTVGVVSPLAADLSLALGSSSVGLMELVSVYGVFANQGVRVEPYAVASVQDSGGRTLEQAAIQPRQVVSRETAYLITNMMEDVIQRGTGIAAKAVIDRPVAGKTGTTNDFTDAWFIGFTPNLATGAWVGFDDRRPLGETESGAHAALPIWIAFMKEALKQLPVVPFEIPEGVMFVKVDPSTALLTDQDEQRGTVELFTKGTEPTKSAGSKIDATEFYKLDQAQDSAPPSPVEP